MDRPGVTRPIGLLAAGLVAVAGLVACSSSGGSATPTSSSSSPAPALASASVGALAITGGYIPEPASPDVAAAYLTITNNGSSDARLTKVTTNVTRAVMAMNETDNGGVGSMTNLTNVTIPAHRSMRFVPNHAHLMLEHPKPLKAGDRVAMTLTFAPSATVTVTLPVLPLGHTPTTSPTHMTMSPGAGMSSMTG